MIDSVCEFGINAVPENYKTPKILYYLTQSKNKIHAHEEYRKRLMEAPISEERIYDLILNVTEDKKQAELVQGYYILEMTRKERVEQ